MKVETGIILASGLLVIFLIWKEIKRPVKAHLLLRLTASVLGVAALVCLAIPVTYTASQPVPAAGALVILTPGYDKDSLPAYKGLPRYTTHAALVSGGITFIPDLRWFLAQHPRIHELQVLGHGLADDELAALVATGTNLQYHTPALPAGFTAAAWPRQLRLGEVLEVQGSFHHPGKERVKIVLSGIGARFDSVIVNPSTTSSFRLQYKPAHLGNTLYELEAISGGKTIAREKVPVRLLPASQVQVLLLSSSPDFDNKFLSTWLYEHQYPVAARYTISKHTYKQQFLNRAALPLQTISATLLEKMDVVIADDQALAALPATERSALTAQVQQGLGLILQTDSAISFNNLAADWRIKKQSGSPVSARSLAIPAVYTTTAPLLPTQWCSIENNRWAQPLVMDDQGAVVVSAALAGAGKLVLNTVNSTYSWILSGHQQDYAQFWSLLLNKAARPAASASRWQQVTAFPRVGSKAQLVLETTTAGIPVIETPDGAAPVAQQAWLPHTWTGSWWPVQPGWQTVRGQQDSLPLYVYEQGDWAAVKATACITANTRHAALSGHTRTSKDLTSEPATKQVPPVIFFVLFLLCCSYLWLEAKKV
ncbi:hypothetical protein HB364_32085 [Pseudoflavitalea sp. X16]|uniref:hypothetical protein n=1 Tax=Paraflavitalea devenefica TaxID=2716334 RepID=UPI0014241DFC|nr:hypothetical protein [Paraflavitalea devenefica]NII29762.1 hypothetical protein [Paraflavitalea devenefica]